MAILIDRNTKVVVQGMTGAAGRAHTKTMLSYGTNIVAGTKPGSKGEDVEGIPVFGTVQEAMTIKGANASIVLVPAQFAKGAVLESINAGIKLIVLPPERIPIHDTMEILELAKKNNVVIVGPNTAGIVAPSQKCKVGFVPNKYFVPGSVGIASRSGTLLYEFGSRIAKTGLGQSACVGVGGDPLVGTRLADVLKLFEEDAETKVSLIIGEIGGSQEEEVAELIKKGEIKKPVVAYIVGSNAPSGKRMGHAGAIMFGGKGTMQGKVSVLKGAGAEVAETIEQALEMLKKHAR